MMIIDTSRGNFNVLAVVAFNSKLSSNQSCKLGAGINRSEFLIATCSMVKDNIVRNLQIEEIN